MGPDGESLYSEGPYRTNERTHMAEPASEGSFRFRLFRLGLYKVTLKNPSASSPRTVTFGWLLGRDADDAFTARGMAPGAGGGAGAGGAGGAPSRNASVLFLDMLARVSRVHKSLDEVVAWQQFVDVRFARSASAAGQTSWRVQWWTIIESSVVVLVAMAQTYMIQSFEVRGATSWLGGGARGGSGGSFSKGASAGRLGGVGGAQHRGLGGGMAGGRGEFQGV